jgi:nucleotide-binding universal stress UspA family protein
VRLLFALELFPRNLPGDSALRHERYEELEDLERTRSRNFLADGAALLKSRGFGEDAVTTAVVIGSPKRAILEEADTWGADLIVVGSHGEGAFLRLLLGSVAHTVALHANGSVRIVKAKH